MALVRRLFPEDRIPREGERAETLLARPGVQLERILSAPGSAAGPFEQASDEWVLLLQGEARLEVAGETLVLGAGEALWLPAHCEHRVLYTSVRPPCIWLALHLG
jgi:cupin 2 domain-containing protein